MAMTTRQRARLSRGIQYAVLVIALIVPLGSIASGRDSSSGRQRRVQVHRSVQQRLTDVGASGEVADVVVRTSKPYAYVSFALGLVDGIGPETARLLGWTANVKRALGLPA